MDDSAPLRRSTRNSVVLKNEELTPRKRRDSTTVKVEPSTPSRRTRASSTTPKKSLVEVMSTPKKTLPVLNEEENTAVSTRTPVKKAIKEVSPKTPRRRTLRESVSTPSRASIDKSSKKPVDASEEINVATKRPMTRAKRKTMGEVQAAEVIITTESEKGVQNRKDKPSAKSVSTVDKVSNSPEIKSDKTLEESCFALVPRVSVTDIFQKQPNDAKNAKNVVDENDCGMLYKSPVRAEDVAINSPRKVPEHCKSITETSLKSDVSSEKTAVEVANAISPVEITDISSVEQAISDKSIKTDSVTNIDVTSPKKVIDSKDNDIPNIVVTSPKKVIDSKANEISKVKSPQNGSSLNDKSIPKIVITSPKKAIELKDTIIPSIVVSSPKKTTDLKDNDRKDCNRRETSPETISPRKNKTNSSSVPTDAEEDIHEKSLKLETSINEESEMTCLPEEHEEKSIKIENKSSSPEKKSSLISENVDENNKFSVKENIVVSENLQMEISEKDREMDDENSQEILETEVNKTSLSKTDIQNKENKEVKIKLISADDEIKCSMDTGCLKVDGVKNVSNNLNEKTLVQDLQVSRVECTSESNSLILKKTDTDVEMAQVEDKDSKETNESDLNKTFDKSKSNEDSSDDVESFVAKDVYMKKSGGSVSQVSIKEVSEIVPKVNETSSKDVITSIKKSSDDTNESKLLEISGKAIDCDSPCLDKSIIESSPEKVNKSISLLEETVTDMEVTPVENEKTKKDEANLSSPNKVFSELSTETSIEEKMVIETVPSVKEISSEAKLKQNSCDKVKESFKETIDESSSVKSVNDSFSKHSKSVNIENETSTEKVVMVKKVDEGMVTEKPIMEEHIDKSKNTLSPSKKISCEHEKSDESADSGILNDVFSINNQEGEVSSELKTLGTPNKETVNARKSIAECKPVLSKVTETEKPTITQSVDSFEDHSDVTLEEVNESAVLESSTSDVKLSSGKSLAKGENDSNSLSAVEDKTETLSENDVKSSESTEELTYKITGLDAILMSPKDFLNSDDESTMDCEKVEDPESRNVEESISERKSEELGDAECDVNDAKHSGTLSEIQDNTSLNVTISGDHCSEGSSTQFNEKQDDFEMKVIASKSADEVETDDSTAVQCDSETDTIPDSEVPDIGVKDTCVEQPMIEISPKKCDDNNFSEVNDHVEINSNVNKKSDNLSESNEICEKVESIGVKDISEKTSSDISEETNPIKPCDGDVSKTEINLQDSLNRSQTNWSPEVEEKSLEVVESKESELRLNNGVGDSESSDSEDSEEKDEALNAYTKQMLDQFDLETEDSELDPDFELSNSISSGVTLCSSDSDDLLTGKDFIYFEAEEGEESLDDSFIASSRDSTASSSSDEPNDPMNIKRRKRKRILDTESSDSANYVDSVHLLFDSSKDSPKDDMHEDSSVKNKKPKLEKVSTVSKKIKKQKPILRNKRTDIELAGKRNKNKTENKIIKEPTKTGVFFVSSVNQDLEEPKLSRKISKWNSKLRMEQKTLEIPSFDRIPNGFSVKDNAEDDAALRGFVVSYDESYLVTKKPRKAGVSRSELISRKKKMKESKKNKKTIKKSESKIEDKNETVSSFVVSLVLPVAMTSSSVHSILTGLGISDITSIDFPKPKVAIVEFSNEDSLKNTLALYGEIKVNDKPIYVLEGCSLV